MLKQEGKHITIEFQSRNRDTSLFRKYFSNRCHCDPLFQSRNRDTSLFRSLSLSTYVTPRMQFQSRNRDTSLFRIKAKCSVCNMPYPFQSRNRDTSLFRRSQRYNPKRATFTVSISQSRYFSFQAPKISTHSTAPKRSFNLAIEILLFSGYKTLKIGKFLSGRFQSRNRDTSLFRIKATQGLTQRSKASFNLAIEILLFSGVHVVRIEY